MPVVYSSFRSRCVVSPQRLFLMPVLPLNPPKSHSCPPRTEENALRAADEDVVDGDVDCGESVSLGDAGAGDGRGKRNASGRKGEGFGNVLSFTK